MMFYIFLIIVLVTINVFSVDAFRAGSMRRTVALKNLGRFPPIYSTESESSGSRETPAIKDETKEAIAEESRSPSAIDIGKKLHSNIRS
jgi:hypothetical protein